MTGKPWFAPKRFGYGAGLPVCWQGWVLMLGHIAIIVGGIILIPRYAPGGLTAPLMLVIVGGSTAIVVPIIRAKTDGGWRWRNGRE